MERHLISICKKLTVDSVVFYTEQVKKAIMDVLKINNERWATPVVEESYNPDRIRLSLEFVKNKRQKQKPTGKRIEKNICEKVLH